MKETQYNSHFYLPENDYIGDVVYTDTISVANDVLARIDLKVMEGPYTNKPSPIFYKNSNLFRLQLDVKVFANLSDEDDDLPPDELLRIIRDVIDIEKPRVLFRVRHRNGGCFVTKILKRLPKPDDEAPPSKRPMPKSDDEAPPHKPKPEDENLGLEGDEDDFPDDGLEPPLGKVGWGPGGKIHARVRDHKVMRCMLDSEGRRWLYYLTASHDASPSPFFKNYWDCKRVLALRVVDYKHKKEMESKSKLRKNKNGIPKHKSNH